MTNTEIIKKADQGGTNTTTIGKATAGLKVPDKLAALATPVVAEDVKREFYISYEGGVRSPKLALLEKVNRDFQPHAAMALSEAIDYKLAQVVLNVFNEPLVIQAEKNRMELEATLCLVMNHPLVTQGMFVVEALLSPREDLPYHGGSHTWKVLKDALAFAIADDCSPREILLVAIAAVFHDIGYVERNKQNEPIGAAYARNAMEVYSKMSLRGEHFTANEVDIVEQMILDTALKFDGDGLHPPKPTIPLSQYLLDADLSNFGRQEFFTDTVNVFQETPAAKEVEVRTFGDLPKTATGNNYLRATFQLLSRHQWWSKTAKTMLGKVKRENTARVERAIV